MMSRWMYKCEDVTELLSKGMDETLPLRVRIGLRIHLMMCNLCSNYAEQLQIIREAVGKISSEEEMPEPIKPLPDDVARKMKAFLEKEEKSRVPDH